MIVSMSSDVDNIKLSSSWLLICDYTHFSRCTIYTVYITTHRVIFEAINVHHTINVIDSLGINIEKFSSERHWNLISLRDLVLRYVLENKLYIFPTVVS